MADGLGLDAWWDEPDYKTRNTFHLRGLFILRKLLKHDGAKFAEVMADLYHDDAPDGSFAATDADRDIRGQCLPDTIDPRGPKGR